MVILPHMERELCRSGFADEANKRQPATVVTSVCHRLRGVGDGDQNGAGLQHSACLRYFRANRMYPGILSLMILPVFRSWTLTLKESE